MIVALWEGPFSRAGRALRNAGALNPSFNAAWPRQFAWGRLSWDYSFLAASVVAVVLMGLSKGGFSGLSVLSMPLLALALPPTQAAAIMLPLLVAQDVVSVIAYRRDWDGRLLAIMLPGATAGVALGYLLAARIPPAAVTLAVGLIAFVFAGRALFLTPKVKERAARGSVAAGLFWGAVGGFTSFISHAGAPPVQVYLMPQRLPPRLYAGLNTMFFAYANAIKLAPYFLLGQFTRENLTISAALAPVAVASAALGVWLVRRVSTATFYAVILWLTLGVGVKLLWDGARGLGWA